LDSPSTFAQEIIVPILHLGNYEGGAMPWHFYLFYFCDHYLYRNITLATVVWIVIGLGAVASVAQMMRSQFRLDLASLSLVIFVFNLVAVTLVSTKSPSFLYQSLLPLLFFCTNLIFTNIGSVFRPFGGLVASGLKPWTLGLLGAVLLVQGGLWAQSYRAERVSPASYDSGIEGLLFKAGDQGYREGWGLRDLVLTGPYDGDLWGRFPFIILTGSESRTVKELKTWLEREDNAELKLRTKFDWIRRVDSNGQVESIRLALIQEGEISKSHFLKVPSE
jgi:hypothetical protein